MSTKPAIIQAISDQSCMSVFTEVQLAYVCVLTRYNYVQNVPFFIVSHVDQVRYRTEN